MPKSEDDCSDWTKWEEKLQQLPYQNTVCAIMQNLINYYLDQQIINDLALDLLPELLERAKEDNIYQIVTTAQMYNGRTYELYHIFSSCGLVARLLSSLSWHDETSFKNYFAVKYAYFHEDLNYINKNQRNIYENMCCNYFSIFEVTYAVWLKLLPVEALYDTLLVYRNFWDSSGATDGLKLLAWFCRYSSSFVLKYHRLKR